jgi:hypothetical protein
MLSASTLARDVLHFRDAVGNRGKMRICDVISRRKAAADHSASVASC